MSEKLIHKITFKLQKYNYFVILVSSTDEGFEKNKLIFEDIKSLGNIEELKKTDFPFNTYHGKFKTEIQNKLSEGFKVFEWPVYVVDSRKNKIYNFTPFTQNISIPLSYTDYIQLISNTPNNPIIEGNLRVLTISF